MKFLCLFAALLPCCLRPISLAPKPHLIAAARTLPVGTIIRDADLTTVEGFPNCDDCPDGPAEDRRLIIGQTVRVEIEQGEVISLKKFSLPYEYCCVDHSPATPHRAKPKTKMQVKEINASANAIKLR